MTLRYAKAPITDAIVDFRVEPRPETSAVELAVGFAELTAEFPKQQELPAADTGFHLRFGSVGPPQIFGGAVVLGGFRYESADGRRIVQVRRDGFVFNLLPPYEDWQAFCAEARPLWERYRSVWRPRRVVRAALRYVNQFDLPESPNGEGLQLGEYFTITPGGPANGLLPSNTLVHYALQMVLPQPDIGATAVVNHALLAPSPGRISLVLDIDLFRESLTWNPEDDTTLWNAMEELRVRKNALFEMCITERTRALLEPQQ